ncbi:S-adenosylmethionine:tRNA ribosyltransferase-isomerase [Candidatus Zixiibacteriota bacterium]|nr:S-adenosylmethionine:tRNA ribosyltransferase-isomerase [candidate division Zixibacteria bacterium]
MKLSLFDYNLPEELIAYYPARRREESRLMILDRETGEFKCAKFPAVLNYMSKGDVLVVNNTKVFKARLFARRPSGGKVEIFLLEEIKIDGINCWQVLTHPSRRIKEGESLIFDEKSNVTIFRKLPDGKTAVKFKSKIEAARIISKFGHIPLPIYIHRPDEKSDESRYQTVYADSKRARAVAAPTAGLHFSKRILDKIAQMGVKIVPVTLHVGYGTFKTIRTEEIEEHAIDPEYVEISKSAASSINKARDKGGKVFAVGTTVVRALESAPYVDGEITAFSGPVDLYIKPGHQFRLVDHLITNFHLPQSSLVILVSSFAGRENILSAYNAAVADKFRFYSYGDCMLIL